MKIALIGYGKMGQTLERLGKAAGHEIVLIVDADNQADLTNGALAKADVAIEFTNPNAAFGNITACFEAGVPVVSGTTAWLDRYEEAVAICKAKNAAFLYASNFSIGVNIFFAVNKYLAKLMDAYPQYKLAMEEIHHTQKLDAPSGTAITLAEGIIGEMERAKAWHNEATSKENSIPIVSKRIDKVPGTHEVVYQSTIDSIEIKHTAHSREGFAKGALLAAEWLVGKKGVFSMSDLLNDNKTD